MTFDQASPENLECIPTMQGSELELAIETITVEIKKVRHDTDVLIIPLIHEAENPDTSRNRLRDARSQIWEMQSNRKEQLDILCAQLAEFDIHLTNNSSNFS